MYFKNRINAELFHLMDSILKIDEISLLAFQFVNIISNKTVANYCFVDIDK